MVAAAAVAVSCLLTACAGPPSGGGLAARVDALIVPLVAARQFSGAVALVRDGQVVHASGHGLARHQPPVAFTPDTQGYRYRQGQWSDHDAYDDEAFLGASNLIVSAHDLARWGNAWATGAALPAAADRAGRQAPLIAGHASAINGASWYCAPDGRRCHYTGSLNGFHALVYWDRDRRESVAFVSNSSIPPWQVITLQRGLVDLLAGRPVGAATPPAAALMRVDAATRAALSGRYVVAGLGRLSLRAAGPGLQLQLGDALVVDAFQVSREVFYVPATDWWLAFTDGGPAGPPGPRLHVRGMYHDAQAVRSSE